MIRTENSGMNFCRRICLHNCCFLSGSACLGIVFGYGQVLLNFCEEIFRYTASAIAYADCPSFLLCLN